MADETKPEGAAPARCRHCDPAPAGAHAAASPGRGSAGRPRRPISPARPDRRRHHRGGAAASQAGAMPPPRSRGGCGRAADDTSPLLSRRAWLGLAWGAFSAASVAALAATGRFMFPNVFNEPPQQFKAGLPNEYGMGVDERWKEKYGIWIVRIADENVEPHGSGFYVLITVCTHLGCTPKTTSGGRKQVQVPVPRQAAIRLTGVNFEGPAPRPLERARVVPGPDDGQILVDKSVHYQYASWDSGPNPDDAFLKA